MTRQIANLPPGQVGGREQLAITELDRVHAAYDDLQLDNLLLFYALNKHNDVHLAHDIEASIDKYGQAVSAIATTALGTQIATVRGAFDRFYEGMEKAATAKFGPKIERPRTMPGLILTRLGLKEPVVIPYYNLSRLDDRYWAVQFAEQYQEEAMVKRLPDEPDQVYAGRYIAACLHGFAWSQFSFI